MASFSNESKYTLGYSVSQGNETTSRLISGLNTGTSTATPDIGPTQSTVANVFAVTLRAFTTGTLGTTGRWIQEKAVTF